MKTAFLHAFALALAIPAALPAQQAPSPGLQQRAANTADDHPVVVLRNHAKSVLPEDASGLYRFGDSASIIAEGVQIDEQLGDVTGYLTTKAQGAKMGMASYFLNHIEGGDGDLSFSTRAVHGVSYSFEGKIVRGQGLSRAQDGFYEMKGELVAHDEAKQTTQRRTIDLKLTGQH